MTQTRTPEDVLDIIVSSARLVLPHLKQHAFQATDKLAELGANSVDRVEIVMMTLETLSLRIPMSQVHGPENIGQLADLLHGKSRAL